MTELPDRWYLQSNRRAGTTIRVRATIAADGTLQVTGGYPALRPGSSVEVRINSYSLRDQHELTAWLTPARHVMCLKGESLRVRVRPQQLSDALRRQVIAESGKRGTPGSFVEVRLDEQLELLEKPSGISQLCDARCVIPSLGRDAKSLNEAYRIVSEAFEPHRRSHSANVFEQVFYYDEGCWITLHAYRTWLERGNGTLRPSDETRQQADLPGNFGQR